MNIKSIVEHDLRNENKKTITIKDYSEPEEERKSQHGTTITLTGVKLDSGSDAIPAAMLSALTNS